MATRSAGQIIYDLIFNTSQSAKALSRIDNIFRLGVRAVDRTVAGAITGASREANNVINNALLTKPAGSNIAAWVGNLGAELDIMGRTTLRSMAGGRDLVSEASAAAQAREEVLQRVGTLGVMGISVSQNEVKGAYQYILARKMRYFNARNQHEINTMAGGPTEQLDAFFINHILHRSDWYEQKAKNLLGQSKGPRNR